jgi:glycosylphosphatidylinositol transamidase (GPIT) subunit GPI8
MIVAPTAAPGEGLILPDQLAATVATMFGEGRYRRLLVAVETCHGGVMGTRLTAPGAMLFAGAAPSEDSLGTNYDGSLANWLADEFAYELTLAATGTPAITLDQLYQRLYRSVGGSHVNVSNAGAFGGLGSVTLQEFLE